MLRIPSYLVRSRHQVFYFRLRIPFSIRTVLQDHRLEHRLSLRTGNLREAARLAVAFASRYHSFFSLIENAVTSKKYSARELADFVKTHFPNGLPASFEHEIFHANGDRHRIVVDTTIPGESELYKDVLGQLVTSTPATHIVTAPIPSASHANNSTPDSNNILFSEAIKEYEVAMAMPDPITRQYPRGFGSVDDRRERINKLRVWPWFIGDIPLNYISADAVKKALERLRLMPPDFKSLKDMPLTIGAVAEAQQAKIEQWYKLVEDLPKAERLEAKMGVWVKLLNTNTVNNYTSVLKIFFEWAAKRKYISHQPVAKLHMPTDNESERTEYTEDEIRTVFESGFFKECNYNEPAQYWVPHIQLFTGARSNEVCQLDVSDIVEIENVWCFRFFPDDYGTQRLKNDQSKRFVPIHSILWEKLGLKKYCEEMRVLSESRQLFPCLLYHPTKQKYNVYYGKWYNDFIRKIGAKRKGLDTHSFRHTVANLLMNMDVEERIASAILGHDITTDGNNQKHKKQPITYKVYGGDYKIETLKETIESLDYKVSLTPFYMTPRRLKETAQKTYAEKKRRKIKSPSKNIGEQGVQLPDDVGAMWDFDPNSIPPSV
jgi:integrase